MEVEIPHPPEKWIVGNLGDVDPENRMASLMKLHALYGPIFSLNMLGNRIVYPCNREICNEVFDDQRFVKVVAGPLYEVRNMAGTGMFTANSDEHDWQLAHKLLMQVFSPMSIQKMFDPMMDITSQMLMKWQRMGPDALIDPVDSFTRLTLDTIALCAFDYRFNSYYQNEMHPFVHKALEALLESGRRASRSSIEKRARIWSEQKYREEIKYCWDICDGIVAERKAHPKEVNDLLNTMLQASDPDTGEKMSDELIRNEMMTFLLAGHDTTSGLLCFSFLLMLRHPQTYQAAQEEVDRVVGDGPLSVKHASELKYVQAVMRETLRLYPTAPAIARRVKTGHDELVDGGKYRIKPTDTISIPLSALHRDPAVWGDDAEEFRPERMLDGGFESKPPNSWKPFGNGERSCIGRAFSWQETWMAIALIMQRFQLELAEPDYQMKIRQTLTIKPTGWHFRARLRPGKGLYSGIVPSHGPEATAAHGEAKSGANVAEASLPQIAVFYGTNQGTCKTFAEELHTSAPTHGFNAALGSLDSATENLPTDKPVVIMTPSYEGQPPDNGKKFVAWLEANQNDSTKLKGVQYCLLGMGNSDWVNTFQRIPKLVDELMTKMGATRMFPTIMGDVAHDIFGPFDEFKDSLWKALASQAGKSTETAAGGLAVEVTMDRPAKVGEKDIRLATVQKHTTLADTSVGPEKKLMEVQLSEETTYTAGDYLVVLPTNHDDEVKNVLNHFGVPADALVKLTGTRKAFLPHESAEYAHNLVASYLEIGTPISRKQVQTLAEATADGKQKEELERLSQTDVFEKELLNKRASIIEVLQKFPECKLSFAAYLDMLQPMKPRQYSIASSPLATAPGSVSILYDVLTAPSMYDKSTTFHGVASTYLSEIPVGGKVHCYVKPTVSNFRLPVDLTTPLVMICAGTGLAPMRGFIQERAAIAEARPDVKFGKTILYFGCRDPEKDYICKSELAEWEKLGIVEVRPTFSQAKSEYKYVPDRLWAERDELKEMFKDGAKFFLCGSAAKLAKSTNEVLEKIVMEGRGCSAEEAKEFMQQQKAERYVTDVF